MNQKKAIVIGCGIAGLATAIRLSVKGYQVTVFEKNSYPGGKLSHFEKNGYQFDAGPSLFTQPGLVTELFALCNEPVEKYFSFKQSDIACKYFFESGAIVNAYADVNHFAEELATKLGEKKSNVSNYLKSAQQTYTNIGQLFLDHPVRQIVKLPLSVVFKALKTTKLSFLFTSLAKYNRKYFSKKETEQIFNRFATYNGSTNELPTNAV